MIFNGYAKTFPEHPVLSGAVLGVREIDKSTTFALKKAYHLVTMVTSYGSVCRRLGGDGRQGRDTKFQTGQ